MTSSIHPELEKAEAAMLRKEIRQIDAGTADEIRASYYELGDKLINLEHALAFARENHQRDPGVTFLTSEQLAERMATLRDAFDDLGAFGVAL